MTKQLPRNTNNHLPLVPHSHQTTSRGCLSKGDQTDIALWESYCNKLVLHLGNTPVTLNKGNGSHQNQLFMTSLAKFSYEIQPYTHIYHQWPVKKNRSPNNFLQKQQVYTKVNPTMICKKNYVYHTVCIKCLCAEKNKINITLVNSIKGLINTEV